MAILHHQAGPPLSPIFEASSLYHSKWQRIKLLGRGSYGVVYLSIPRNPIFHCSNSLPPPSVVLKSSPINHSQSLQKELFLLKNLKECPEIVKCYGFDISIEKGLPFYNLVLEYACGGTLSDLIANNNNNNNSKVGLKESEVRLYTRMILKGLHSLHQQGCVHCDLKPENILVFLINSDNGTTKKQLKIADFGLAQLLPRQKSTSTSSPGMLFPGTPYYMSPEAVAPKGEVSEELDIWSLGCIVIEMMTGKIAWDNCSNMEEFVYRLVSTDETPRIPDHMSVIGKDFLKKCFERDPKRRSTAWMLLLHPFLCETQEKHYFSYFS